MIDSVLKGTGNSRFLKSAVPAGTSWADALAMLQAGTFPIDFNGINTAGFQQVGTPLNKANLLKDATAAQIGLPPSTTPDGMFQALGNTGELHVWRKTVTTAQEIPAGYTLGDALENINPIKLTNRNYDTAWFTVVSSVKIDDNGNAQFTDADSDYTRYMRWNSSEHAFEGYDVVSGNGPGSIRHDAIPGNFIKFWAISSSWLSSLIDMDSFYFVPSDATVTTGSTPEFSKLQRVVGYAKVPAGTTTTYPVSTNPNAYQEGDDAKEAGYTLGEVVTGKFRMGDLTPSNAYEYEYAAGITVDENGTVSLQNPSEFSINSESHQGYESTISSLISGKFLRYKGRNSSYGGSDAPDTQHPFDATPSVIVYIPADVVVTSTSTWPAGFYIDRYQPVTGYAAIPAGTTIEYLGKLGDKARVQVVSYVGTGTYGSSNPNSLTFDFVPKCVIIRCEGSSTVKFDWIIGMTDIVVKWDGNYHCSTSITGKTLSFYSYNSAYYQMNEKGEKYYAVAIG